MKNKIMALALSALLFALCLRVEAQPPAKIPRIGYLTSALDQSNPNRDALRQGLRDLGWIEGQNILIEYRYAEGKNERLADLAADLVRLKVDLIVTTGGTATNAAKQATTLIPIVFTQVGAPDKQTFVANLARPGGNITGLSNVSEEVSGKRLELLKETVPKVSRVGVLWDSATGLHSSKATEEAARLLGIQLQVLEATGRNDFDRAFEAATKWRAGAITVLSSGIFHTHREALVRLASKNGLPSVYDHKNYAAAGGLMSYGPDVPEMFRRAAYYVDRILKGTKPADLPVEQPTKFELVINLKTAKQIGLTIPPNVLARADRVIR
jgi:putative ABC transport system substrate-binding protein